VSTIDSRIAEVRAKVAGLPAKEKAQTDRLLKQIQSKRDRVRMNAAALQREMDDLSSTLQLMTAAGTASAGL
jgi:hypothetical protein